MSKEEKLSKLKELEQKLSDEAVDCFYSECLKPATEADIVHNTNLCTGLKTIREQINELEKEPTDD